ncbi:MAG: recombinase family protein, partial [Planctomycetota bacterium]
MTEQNPKKKQVTFGNGISVRPLRIPIVQPVGRPIRAMIYARYSTDEQNPRSIEDQVRFCQTFLERENLKNVALESESDRAVSGERVSRPGINRVRDGVEDRRWDLIIVEDASRLYRNHTACMHLVEMAIDNDIRVIAINDNVDTAEDDWDDKLHDALREHVRANRYTRKRVRRAVAGLWEEDAAMGLLRPGYRRTPTHPATEKEPASGPHFDEVDPKWAPVILEAYERIARDEPAWLVGQFLTESGLPKCKNFSRPEWSERNVISLIRRTIHRGFETYRETQVRKYHTRGVGKPVRSNEDEVWTREMEKLRIVPDYLWYAANAVIDGRLNRPVGPHGTDHPLAGIPRESRGPLSGFFFCGICGGKMYLEGRAEGGYRCNAAAEGKCWNKATSAKKDVHEGLSAAIASELNQAADGISNMMVDLRTSLSDDTALRAQIENQRSQVCNLAEISARYLDAIGSGKEAQDKAPKILVERLAASEDEKAVAEAELQRLEDLKSAPTKIPTADDIRELLNKEIARLSKMDREANVVLRRLAPRIKAVPYEQFGGNKVVLRARFFLNPNMLLPSEVLVYFEKGLVEGNQMLAASKPMLVNLFEPSVGPREFARALAMSEKGMTLVEIGQALGVSKRSAHIAVQYGRDMKAAGLTDPYRELTERPAKA